MKMGMQTHALLVLGVCGILLIVIAICSWLHRRKQEEKVSSISRIQETIVNGQRTFRIATVSRHDGQLTLDIYEIRLPRPNDPASGASIRLLPSSFTSPSHSHPPPPPFSTAINMPVPNQQEPPKYEEVAQAIRKLSENRNSSQNSS